MMRISQVDGQSAATVMRPSGGFIPHSGIIASAPSKPQKDGGKLGHTIKTLRFGPSGGKESRLVSTDNLGSGEGTKSGQVDVVEGGWARRSSQGSGKGALPPLLVQLEGP